MLADAPIATPSKVLGPPLKWAGGKRWQVPHLVQYWEARAAPPARRAVRGGLAVALGLQPERAILNDINPHLINFYTWLKNGLVIDEKFSHSETGYYKARRRFNQLLAEGASGRRKPRGSSTTSIGRDTTASAASTAAAASTCRSASIRR